MKCDHVRDWHEYDVLWQKLIKLPNQFQDAQKISIVSGANNFIIASKSHASLTEKSNRRNTTWQNIFLVFALFQHIMMQLLINASSSNTPLSRGEFSFSRP